MKDVWSVLEWLMLRLSWYDWVLDSYRERYLEWKLKKIIRLVEPKIENSNCKTLINGWKGGKGGKGGKVKIFVWIRM